MADMNPSSSDERPGRDPARPHQDLRITSRVPMQYFSQALPGPSSLSATSSTLPQSAQSNQTTPVAVQIASLHRAAEVARFEWRASQRHLLAQREEQRRSDARRPDPASRPYQPLPATRGATDGRAVYAHAEAGEGAPSRTFASSLDAYLSAARELTSDLPSTWSDRLRGVNLDEYQSDDDSSMDSHDTEDEVIASTMRPSLVRRRESDERRASRATRAQSRPGGTRFASILRAHEAQQQAQAVRPSSGDDVLADVAEARVWDRMVEDLAIGAGVGNHFRALPHGTPDQTSRGISAGLATSLLALSAAVPRPDPSNGGRDIGSSRLLPHPIWARRYMGAAGEWLRGELARRANSPSSTTQQTARRTPRGNTPTWGTTRRTYAPDSSMPFAEESWTGPSEPLAASVSAFDDIFSNPRTEGRADARVQAETAASSPWTVLRFPSLDPTTRSGNPASDTPPPAAVRSDVTSGNSLTVPASASALAPVPPPLQATTGEAVPVEVIDLAASSQSTEEPRTLRSSASQTRAADLVARMAQLTRDRNALTAMASSSDPFTGAPRAPERTTNSRAVRGGLDYIRRLRVLDGLEPGQSEELPSSRDTLLADGQADEPNSPGRAHEVFPWYAPDSIGSSSDLAHSMARLDVGATSTRFDPDGSSVHWYQMARARLTAQSTLTGRPEANDDPNGERDEEGEEEAAAEVTMRARRRVITSAGGVSAAMRQRNRSALVISDEDAPMQQDGNGDRNSVTHSAAWTPEGWTVIDQRQRPASPVRQTRDEGSNNVTTWFRGPAFSTSPGLIDHAGEISASNSPTGTGNDFRTTRRPRRMASLTVDDLAARGGMYRPPSVARWTVPEPDERRPGWDGPAPPVRSLPVPQAQPSRRPEYASGLRDEPPRIGIREDTPSPEPRPPPTVTAQTSSELMSGSARDPQRIMRLHQVGARLEEEFRARQGELRLREERLRSEVARRRLELDQLRQQQGRIGRVVERSRRDRDEAVEALSAADEGVTTASAPSATDRLPDPVLRVASDVEQAQTGTGSGAGSLTLVRRRTVRDSAPNLRPFRRPDSRRSAIAARSTTASSLPIINDSINRQMTLNTLTAFAQSQHGLVPAVRRTRSFTASRPSTLSRLGADDRTALDDQTIVRGRSHDVLLATTPSVSPSDVDTIGAAGASLVSFVDALATPWSIVRAARFATLPSTSATVIQPALPSTLDESTYPLRFELAQSRVDEVAGGSATQTRLQNVLQNDESTCAIQGAESSRTAGLQVMLRFLAATGGSTGQTKATANEETVTAMIGEEDKTQAESDSSGHADSTALSMEEQQLVQRCLDAIGPRHQAALLEPSEILHRAGAVGQELLSRRTDSLSRSALLRPADQASDARVADVGPSFCLTKLVIKIPHRHTLFASLAQASASVRAGLNDHPYRWLALVFVSWTPITSADLAAYDGWSEEDIRRAARRHGRNGPGFERPSERDLWKTETTRPTPFDDDETLGDPTAMEVANSKGKEREGEDGDGGSESRPSLLPVGMAHLQFSQTVFSFDSSSSGGGADAEQGSSSSSSSSNSGRGGASAATMLNARGVSGRHLAVKVMRVRRATSRAVPTAVLEEGDGGDSTPPALEIQWIGAHGWAGPRSFGAAAWRED